MQFLKVSDGFGGQIQAIGLFELDEVSDVDDTTFAGHDVRQTPFHHFAFIIDRQDYDSEFKRISAYGYELRTIEHSLSQSRSFYLYDPQTVTPLNSCATIRVFP